MFVSDVSDFKFVGKVEPAFCIAKEEVTCNSTIIVYRAYTKPHVILPLFWGTLQ